MMRKKVNSDILPHFEVTSLLDTATGQQSGFGLFVTVTVIVLSGVPHAHFGDISG